MQYYSLMLLPEKGAVKNFRVYRASFYVGLILIVSLVSFGIWGLFSMQNSQMLGAQLEQARNQLALLQQQKTKESKQLHAQLDTEREKMAVYAKNIGQLEARLMRLDSLGKHLVEVSSLDKSDFNFDIEPALGGPLVEAQSADVEIHSRVLAVNSQLSDLDTKLAAIDTILEDDRESQQARPHAWPSEGGWLSSRFGVRTDPFTGKKARHMGVDIANHLHAPVLASSRGVVSFSGKMTGFGYLVKIDHGYGYQTYYAHLAKVNVTVGDEVEAGKKVGEVGLSGRSTGPHLHFEVRRFGVPLDPKKYLPKS